VTQKTLVLNNIVQVDIINEKFAEAREEIEYAREDAETVRQTGEEGWWGGGACKTLLVLGGSSTHHMPARLHNTCSTFLASLLQMHRNCQQRWLASKCWAAGTFLSPPCFNHTATCALTADLRRCISTHLQKLLAKQLVKGLTAHMFLSPPSSFLCS
jgi:hypothetical protein